MAVLVTRLHVLGLRGQHRRQAICRRLGDFLRGCLGFVGRRGGFWLTLRGGLTGDNGECQQDGKVFVHGIPHGALDCWSRNYASVEPAQQRMHILSYVSERDNDLVVLRLVRPQAVEILAPDFPQLRCGHRNRTLEHL